MAASSPPLGEQAAGPMTCAGISFAVPKDQLGPAQVGGALSLDHQLTYWAYATACSAQLEGLIGHAFVCNWYWHCGAPEAHKPA